MATRHRPLWKTTLTIYVTLVLPAALGTLGVATGTLELREQIAQLSEPPKVEPMRRRSDRLHVRSLGAREREALSLIERRAGITIAELADALDVGMARVWQIVGRLELHGVYREQLAPDTSLKRTKRPMDHAAD